VWSVEAAEVSHNVVDAVDGGSSACKTWLDSRAALAAPKSSSSAASPRHVLVCYTSDLVVLQQMVYVKIEGDPKIGERLDPAP